ncbi:hypothetical protein LTR27_009296 [Elasticomyces elasticus]|nr:hypothetical protein LTR27_009296 [Elasticomyces elasticus]
MQIPPRYQNEVAANEAFMSFISGTMLEVLGLPLTDKCPLSTNLPESVSLILDGARIGDLVVQVDGWLHPVVLRENAMENTFEFVCLAEYASSDRGFERLLDSSIRRQSIMVGMKQDVSKMRRAFQKHMQATQQHAMERFVVV